MNHEPLLQSLGLYLGISTLKCYVLLLLLLFKTNYEKTSSIFLFAQEIGSNTTIRHNDENVNIWAQGPCWRQSPHLWPSQEFSYACPASTGTAGDNSSCALGGRPPPRPHPQCSVTSLFTNSRTATEITWPRCSEHEAQPHQRENIPPSATVLCEGCILSVGAKQQNLRLSVLGQLITGPPARKLLEAFGRGASLSLLIILHPSAQRKLALVPKYRLKTLTVFQKQSKRMKENRPSGAEGALPGAWKESWGRESREGEKEVSGVRGLRRCVSRVTLQCILQSLSLRNGLWRSSWLPGL